MIAAAVPYLAGVLTAGGLAVGLSRRRELVQRWMTWTVTAVLVVVALSFGSPGSAALAAAVGVVAAVEYGRLTCLGGGQRVLLLVTLGVLPITAWLAPFAWLQVCAGGLISLALAPVVTGEVTDGARRAAFAILGLVWLAPLSAIVVLDGEQVFALLVAVAVVDVGAWCAGRALGHTRWGGAPLSVLSPAKTRAGLLGGAGSGIAALAALHLLVPVLTPALVLAVLVGPPAGDLVESMLKRGAGVKDTGSWVPGFGGILDRIDSMLLALAIAVVLS
ncbi:phosphatidate cytidylyltransferase [Lipingzhangella sp. LS1_29]|uniref:Phosphatidate cytidylyltransferase n=1 Tax=Lipingzhangella rawalii TaxID=2055835 RepID=A0ABU2H2I5_9ACTN|nr:phosphatidate cytidylyltransferase [Lipingzhangella rawalii]MDS1269515.1 phosphatidate cytidylyltransferase [Lipingzhangella rawalii]